MNVQELGRIVELKLLDPYDVVSFSRWAYQMYLDNLSDLSGELQDVLLDLSRMEDGVEFEYSREEVRIMARRMLSE
jgi:hypothetical protein